MAIYSRYKAKFGKEVEALPVPIQNTDNPYTDEAAMHADQSNQLEGYGYLVTGVGAFIYLGTLAGTAEDYEAFMPTKDIILKSDNTSSTLYFYDNLTYDTQYAFIRYNASNNNLEFGSKDGSIQDEVISAIIDRGKTDWQFKDTIQINNPGKGVWMHSPDNTSYQIRTNDGGVLELWTTDGSGNLETLVWSAANVQRRTTKRIVSDAGELIYTLTSEDKYKFLNLRATQSSASIKIVLDPNVFELGDEIEGYEHFGNRNVTIKSNMPYDRYKRGLATVNSGELIPDGYFKIRIVNRASTGALDPTAALITGDFIQAFEVVASPDGTLHKIGVANDGTRTSTLL